MEEETSKQELRDMEIILHIPSNDWFKGQDCFFKSTFSKAQKFLQFSKKTFSTISAVKGC